MSITMILGVLLITRPCAIFGHDYKEKTNEPASSTVRPYFLPDDIEPGLHVFKLIPINVSNYDEEIQDNTTIGLYAGSMSPVGYFYSELKQHTYHDSHYFTPTNIFLFSPPQLNFSFYSSTIFLFSNLKIFSQ